MCVPVYIDVYIYIDVTTHALDEGAGDAVLVGVRARHRHLDGQVQQGLDPRGGDFAVC